MQPLGLNGGSLSLAALVDNLPCAVSVLDRDLRFVAVNDRWEDLFRTAREAVVGRPYREIFTYAQGVGVFAQVLEGQSIRSPGFAVPRPDNSTFDGVSSLTPWFDAAGAVAGVMISNVELIGEAAEQLAARTEDRLRSAVELAGLYVWEIDQVEGSSWASDANFAFFDEDFSLTAFNADPLSVVHPEDRPQVEALWDQEISRIGRYVTEYRTNRSDKVQWARGGVVAFASSDPGRPRLVGVMQDITERKTAELGAHHANAVKSNFLATMSHEIRTPLNGVLGMAQAMAADPLPEEQHARLGIIRQSGESLLAILNDVLDFSKIESGKLEIEQVAFDLGEVVDGVQANFEALAQQKGVSLDVDIGAARGVYRGDPTRLRQILSNLVSNALKFTDQGGVGVGVARRAGGLAIEVRDTGIGIAPEHLDSVFHKFEQADASTTRQFGGTGLGLAICRELATLMGGSIGVESQPGRGAVFTVTLPLRRVGDARPRRAAPATPAAWKSPALRVLAAEDNAVNRLVLATLLGQAGVSVTTVENGALAVEAWASGDWDVILMDVQMPVMDGLAATAAIRRQETAAGRPRTPIIALTANAMSHQVAEYLTGGMDGHVAKPIDARALFTALEAATSADTAPREARTA